MLVNLLPSLSLQTLICHFFSQNQILPYVLALLQGFPCLTKQYCYVWWALYRCFTHFINIPRPLCELGNCIGMGNKTAARPLCQIPNDVARLPLTLTFPFLLIHSIYIFSLPCFISTRSRNFIWNDLLGYTCVVEDIHSFFLHWLNGIVLLSTAQWGLVQFTRMPSHQKFARFVCIIPIYWG